MHSVYAEQDYLNLKQQIRRRMLLFGGIFLLTVVLVAVTLILDDHRRNRPELATTLAVILGGGSMIFVWDLLIHPLTAYARHLDAALHGRSHEAILVFDRFHEEVSLVDGVTYQDLIFLGEPDKHGDRERMFYWDKELPMPEFSPGQEVTLRYFDKFITGWKE